MRASAYVSRKTQERNSAGPEISLQEEEGERDADAAEDGQHVVRTRHVEPGRHVKRAHRSSADLTQQIPAPREVPGQKQREQQADELHRLQRSEIDFRIAAGGPGAEHDQRRRQRQRTHQWQIAEAGAGQPPEVDRGDERKTQHAGGRQLRVPDEERRIAQRILAAEKRGEAKRGEQMRGGQQLVVAANPTCRPEQDDEPDAGQIDRAPSQRPAAGASRLCERSANGLIVARSPRVRTGRPLVRVLRVQQRARRSATARHARDVTR